MKSVCFLLVIVTSLCLSTGAWGQQTSSSAEIQQILKQVTSQPRNTWIPVGTIAAGATGECAAEGVFVLKAETSETWADGDDLFWNASDGAIFLRPLPLSA